MNGAGEPVAVSRAFLRKNGPPIAMPLEDFYRMLAALEKAGMTRERFMVFVLGKTGLRLGEFLGLRPSDFSFGDCEKKIAIRTSRRARPVWHRVSAEVAEVLEAWVRDRSLGPKDILFPYSKSMARHMFRCALKVAGLPSTFRIRSLRHMYGLTAVRAGVSRTMLAEILREPDLDVCDVYFRMAREN